MNIYNYLHNTLGYSQYEIKQIRYTVVSVLSELSKLFLMGIFFFVTKEFLLYLFAITILLFLRTCTGGLHCKHYFSCLILSFFIIYLSTNILPNIHLQKPLYFIGLLLCVIVNYLLAPIVSCYHPLPNKKQIQKSKRQSFIIIIIYAGAIFVIPTNLYITTGFWIIMLQSFQLILAKKLGRRGKYETH